jgi:hypothetical protein
MTWQLRRVLQWQTAVQVRQEHSVLQHLIFDSKTQQSICTVWLFGTVLTVATTCCCLPWCPCLQVLLSDQSGFLPAVYRAQGNELVSLTPWQVGEPEGSRA